VPTVALIAKVGLLAGGPQVFTSKSQRIPNFAKNVDSSCDQYLGAGGPRFKSARPDQIKPCGQLSVVSAQLKTFGARGVGLLWAFSASLGIGFEIERRCRPQVVFLNMEMKALGVL